MTFLWTREAGALTSTCVLCGMSTRSLSEAAIYLSQRGHDAMTCQRRRAEAARVVEAEEDDVDRCPDGHERAGNTHVDTRGNLVCNACRREKYAAKKVVPTTSTGCPPLVHSQHAQSSYASTVLAHGWTRLGEQSEMAPSVNSKPSLSTPDRTRKGSA